MVDMEADPPLPSEIKEGVAEDLMEDEEETG
jgi:hypothetical protein